jgi:hypothetical protein
MENITIKKNHLQFEVKKENFNKKLKSELKELEGVKIFNAIILSDKIKISIHPNKFSNLTILKNEVSKKILEISLNNKQAKYCRKHLSN